MQAINFEAIPLELTQHPFWAVWKRGEMNTTTRRYKKPPYTPSTGKPARVNVPGTWESFWTAQRIYLQGGWDGVGVHVTAGDPFLFLDLDSCRDPETGDLTPHARDLIERFASYTEVSPSGTGMRIVVKAKLVGRTTKPLPGIEMYDSDHFLTLTGHHAERAIEERQAELDAWYAEVCGDAEQEAADPEGITAFPVNLSDERLIEKAKASKNGPKFTRLWEGAVQRTEPMWDESANDLALCRLLAYWTGKDAERMERLFRQSGLFATKDDLHRLKWDERHYASGDSYSEHTIRTAIASQREVYRPGRREDRRTLHPHPWQQVRETPRERKATLKRIGDRIEAHVQAHLAGKGQELLAITAAPGTGKTFAAAGVGLTLDVAYIAERHDQAGSVDDLKTYREIMPPDGTNCAYHEQHAHLAAKSCDLLGWHLGHGCDYSKQFTGEGSAIYMVEHVPTPYPLSHADGVVLDEFNLSKWLPERAFTQQDIEGARVVVAPESREDQLLRALQETITSVAQAARGAGPYPRPVYGHALFEALNRRCGGCLAEWLEELAQNPANLATRRPVTSAMVERPEQVPPLVLAPLLVALLAELPKWRAGQDWNGLVRVARVRTGQRKQRVLRVTERLRFFGDGPASLVLLDATADAQVLARVFDRSVHIVPAPIDPPPTTCHFHVPTRYNKTSLEARHGRDLQRAINTVQYLLRPLNPDGTKTVALITFESCVEALCGEGGLRLSQERRGHFWAERGSNQKEACDILVIVGTPTLPPDEVARLARALYRDDPAPLDEGSEPAEGEDGGGWRYRDPRMAHLDAYLINAELTQCAHRNRPLRYDGRVVVTLCQGEIAYLPVTETVQALPLLDATGTPKRDTRMERAEVVYLEMVRRGEPVTCRAFREAAGFGQGFAMEFLRRRRSGEQAIEAGEEVQQAG